MESKQNENHVLQETLTANQQYKFCRTITNNLKASDGSKTAK